LVRRVKRAGHFGLPTFEKGNSMLNLIYHVVSASGALGYGNPRELLRLAFGGTDRCSRSSEHLGIDETCWDPSNKPRSNT
jgi:hypothetical protein